MEYAGRRKITNVSTRAAQIVDMERAEGVVSEEGSPFNAASMNDLEQRAADAFSAVQQDIEGINSDLASGQIEFSFQDGKGVYRKKGADTWLPFKSKPTSIVVSAGSRNGYTNNFDLKSIPEYGKLILFDNMFPVAMHLGSAAGVDYTITGTFSYAYNSNTGVLSITFIQDNAASYRGIDKITLYYFP